MGASTYDRIWVSTEGPRLSRGPSSSHCSDRLLVTNMRGGQLVGRSLLCQLFRGFSGDVHRSRGAHVCRKLLAIVVLVSLVTLLPLASADPSDPTWLVGIYDEADGDSVVWLIDRMELRIHPQTASVGKPDSNVSRPLRAIEVLRCPSDAPPEIISLVASPSRAPPLREGDGLVRSPSFHRLDTRKPVPAIRPFDPSHVKHSGETGTRVDPRSPLALLVLRASPL